MSTQYTNYELVVSRVHDYYNLPFSTFACQGNTLMVHISFYIKLINQEPLHMYEIKSIAVPYHMNEELIDETESKYTYTKIKPSTEILAMGSNGQINLDYNQLVHCIQYNIFSFVNKCFWPSLVMNTLVKVLSMLIKILNRYNRNVKWNTILI